MKKYLCPRHREDTPSAHAYPSGFKCFGCGATGPLSELGIPAGERIELTYVEDLQASLTRIKALPKKMERGFILPFDNTSYYLVYPGDTYYKRRIEGAEDGNKYRGPTGHKKPWFFAKRGKSGHLILIEGEFNALSYAKLETEHTVVSPGGAGDFYSRGSEQMLVEATHIPEITLVLDADKAGAQAAIECKSKLLTYGAKNVKIVLVDKKKDFNDVLCKEGQEGLRKYCEALGLLGGVPRD